MTRFEYIKALRDAVDGAKGGGGAHFDVKDIDPRHPIGMLLAEYARIVAMMNSAVGCWPIGRFDDAEPVHLAEMSDDVCEAVQGENDVHDAYATESRESLAKATAGARLIVDRDLHTAAENMQR